MNWGGGRDAGACVKSEAAENSRWGRQLEHLPAPKGTRFCCRARRWCRPSRRRHRRSSSCCRCLRRRAWISMLTSVGAGRGQPGSVVQHSVFQAPRELVQAAAAGRQVVWIVHHRPRRVLADKVLAVLHRARAKDGSRVASRRKDRRTGMREAVSCQGTRASGTLRAAAGGRRRRASAGLTRGTASCPHRDATCAARAAAAKRASIAQREAGLGCLLVTNASCASEGSAHAIRTPGQASTEC